MACANARAVNLTNTMFHITGLCGESNLTAAEDWGYLSSPGFPDNYINNIDCSWTIHSKSNYIELEILYLNLETDYDYVRLYDGSSPMHGLMAALTSYNGGGLLHTSYWTDLPTIIADIEELDTNSLELTIYYTSGRHMYISFISDEYISERGFLFRFRGLSQLPTTTPPIFTTVTTTPASTGDLI